LTPTLKKRSPQGVTSHDTPFSVASDQRVDGAAVKSVQARPLLGNAAAIAAATTAVRLRKAPRFTRAAAKMPFPVPDEQRGFLGYEAVDGAVRSQNGQFACSLSAPAVLAWNRQALAAQGYEHNARESSEALGVFVKPGSSVTVAVQALEEKKGAMVFVNRIEGGDR